MYISAPYSAAGGTAYFYIIVHCVGSGRTGIGLYWDQVRRKEEGGGGGFSVVQEKYNNNNNNSNKKGQQCLWTNCVTVFPLWRGLSMTLGNDWWIYWRGRALSRVQWCERWRTHTHTRTDGHTPRVRENLEIHIHTTERKRERERAVYTSSIWERAGAGWELEGKEKKEKHSPAAFAGLATGGWMMDLPCTVYVPRSRAAAKRKKQIRPRSTQYECAQHYARLVIASNQAENQQ